MTIETMQNSVSKTGLDARLAARHNKHTTPTAGISPGYIQANMIVLPSRYAADFRNLCARNPVPCPLIAESSSTGSFSSIKTCIKGLEDRGVVSTECDLRTDLARYMVYKNSKLVASHVQDVIEQWTEDHVAFLIGCSYSFETELIRAGLPPQHILLGRNVSMYRTTTRLCPAGVFVGGTYVVSMRMYKRSQIGRVREVTSRFGVTHGEPVDWGWEAVGRLGIRDLGEPEWGDAPVLKGGFAVDDGDREDEEEVPVFWGCGVTPQDAVMRAGLEGVVLAHAPGYMLVLDVKDEDILDVL
ncbi:N-terminal binuclear Zn cluster-containing/DNA binding domain-containing protein [Pochonia chlamydosporia 170]|uniref:N-terminal binuclear Zn cluster-containing/DNA binding domain-containing protein n=1 Tax=Pochonia chlamydosporia 170 TaxID=1380566 RepID=A0A179G2S8_METCM|nr:N-terminal binuclear Zn cluster-containing/DNA binding domain-containing protein [Pochonia chlamydosporia 170]OAQ72172.1 N-terminal binuclear Zn cluster-containing/DNA binding domain-containing protein [Pochonia chlamydosporia 170]